MFGYIYFAMVESVREMFRRQHDLATFTAQTGHHEPNLSFHLANELWRYFPWLSCDFDVKKAEYNKRPDLIFHRRGINDLNLLVVEVKRNSNNKVRNWICDSDERRIWDDWFNRPLLYPFGVSVVLDEQTSEFAFVLFQRESQKVERFTFDQFQNGYPEDSEIVEFVNKIIAAKHADARVDTSDAERRIDELVYALYCLTDEEIALVEGR